MVGAVVFFILAMALDDVNALDWLSLGLIFLTVGLLSDTLDLTFKKKWE